MEHPMQWIAYIDGSATPNPGRMSIGGVAHGPEGQLIQFSERLPSIGCNNEAEARAAWHMLRCLLEQQAQHVLIYTDNSILAEQLTTLSIRPVARLEALYTAVRDCCTQFEQVSVQWIPRHRNVQADALARAAAQQKTHHRATR